jgi:hypothetical protein
MRLCVPNAQSCLINRERISVSFVEGLIPELEFAICKQHTRRTSTAAPVYRAMSGLPTSGYALVADGQIKSEFSTHDGALKAARDLKGRFPMLQVKVYDAEKKRGEKIEIAAA